MYLQMPLDATLDMLHQEREAAKKRIDEISQDLADARAMVVRLTQAIRALEGRSPAASLPYRLPEAVAACVDDTPVNAREVQQILARFGYREVGANQLGNALRAGVRSGVLEKTGRGRFVRRTPRTEEEQTLLRLIK